MYNEVKGGKYNEFKGVVELAKIVREYVKKYQDYEFSITADKGGWTGKLYIKLTGGKCLTTQESDMRAVKGNINEYALVRENVCEEKRFALLTNEALEMLIDINNFVRDYHYVDSCIQADYYNCNFYYDIMIDYYYIIKDKDLKLITEKSMCKTYAELYRIINGKRVQVEYTNEDNYHKNYVGKIIVKSNHYNIERENDKRLVWCEKQNKVTRILENGFEKLDSNMQPFVRYTIIGV